MKVIFARHGESTANTLHVFSNQQADHPLTEKGRDQAQALAQTVFQQLNSLPSIAVRFPGQWKPPRSSVIKFINHLRYTKD